MWTPWNGPQQRAAYERALVSGQRIVRFRATLYTKFLRPVGIPLFLAEGGGVTDELWGTPQSRANINLLDNRGLLPPQDDPRWLSWNVGVVVEQYVEGTWLEIPLFLGPVDRVSQSDNYFEIDCDSRDVQHLEPYTFPRPTVFRKHMKIHQAIRRGLEDRGEERLDLDHVRRRLHAARVGRVGVSPMKVFRAMARDADHQLYLRGDGTWRLRDWPEAAVWRFTVGRDGTMTALPLEQTSIGPVRDTIIVKGSRTEKVWVTKKGALDQKAVAGATSIHVANDQDFVDLLKDGARILIGSGGGPEERTIDESYTQGSRTIPLKRALDRGHAVGARVTIRVKQDKEIGISARATLPPNHRYSAESLTGGKRPRIAEYDRNVHKVSRAREIAERIRDRTAGEAEQETSIETVPIWHLEVGDIYLVPYRDVDHRSRIRRLFTPFDHKQVQQIDWLGERRPRRRR